MTGRLRPPRRTVARTAGGLLAVGVGGALLIGGASPAQARTVPKPSPSVTTAPGLSIHLDLGLLNVHVDLPPLTNLLGGAPTPSTVPRQPAVVVPGPSSVPSSAAPRTTRTSAPAAPRPKATPRSTPTRTAQTGGGAGVASDRDVAPVVVRTSPKAPKASKTPRKSVTKRRIAEANNVIARALHPGAPAWLLLSVVGLCALGTAGFVRLAGRKDRAGV